MTKYTMPLKSQILLTRDCALPPQHIIGLTGNIASGKTTAARILADLGAEVIDADAIAHDVLGPDTAETAEVEARFGPSVIAPDRSVDRAALGQIVFRDNDALADLEAIVHPSTRRRIVDRIQASTAIVAVVEAIKLLEGPLVGQVDSVWVVTAPREIQIQRLIRERGLSEETAALRVDSQNPEAEKVLRADVVIRNEGAPRQLRAQVEAAWSALMERLSRSGTPAR